MGKTEGSVMPNLLSYASPFMFRWAQTDQDIRARDDDELAKWYVEGFHGDSSTSGPSDPLGACQSSDEARLNVLAASLKPRPWDWFGYEWRV